VGGSLILNSGADFTASNGTTTFTTTGANRTIDLNEDALHHVAFTGSGSWTITDATFTANGNVSMTAGTLDFPTGTSTFNGSFTNNGGTFDANNGVAYFTGSGFVRMGGSSLATTTFTGGNYSMTDTNATSTGSVTIESGTITFPSGSYAIGGNLENLGGAITHNNSRIALTSATTATLLASSSNLFAIDFRGGGPPWQTQALRLLTISLCAVVRRSISLRVLSRWEEVFWQQEEHLPMRRQRSSLTLQTRERLSIQA
jgi:hypothetical protein